MPLVADLLKWPFLRWKRTLGDPAGLVGRFSPDQRDRYGALRQHYDLSRWPSVCTPLEYVGNLQFLDLFDRHLAARKLQGPALDVGSRRWWYLPAQMSYLPGAWDGVELSARQRNRRICHWKGYASDMCRPFPGARYLPRSVTDLSPSYRTIMWFLPYVAWESMRSSGLSPAWFAPERMLASVWDLLEPGGTLFVVNQGIPEAELQGNLFDRMGIPADYLGEMRSPFPMFNQPRFAWIADKE